MTGRVRYHNSDMLLELIQDIELGKLAPLTSVKNIEGVLSEFIHEYEDYDKLVNDLVEWGYVRWR